jgi:Flp pilus assembly protein TadG
MKAQKGRYLSGEFGTEIVELVIVLPLLAILLIGGIEFGRAMYTYNIITKSMRNAARYVSADSISTTGVIPGTTITKAKNLAVYGNISGTGSPIAPGFTTSNVSIPAGNVVSTNKIYVTVSAAYSYPSLFNLFLRSSTFRPSVTMIFVGTFTT